MWSTCPSYKTDIFTCRRIRLFLHELNVKDLESCYVCLHTTLQVIILLYIFDTKGKFGTVASHSFLRLYANGVHLSAIWENIALVQ